MDKENNRDHIKALSALTDPFNELVYNLCRTIPVCTYAKV